MKRQRRFQKEDLPNKETPFTREVKRLSTMGKAPDVIAVRLGAKMSRILAILHPN
jgi:hypothetical protein